MKPKLHPYSSRTFPRLLEEFRSAVSSAVDVDAAVGEILAAVRLHGDEALLDYAHRFDGVRLRTADLAIGPGEMEAGWRGLAPAERKALRAAIREVRAFHERSRPVDWSARNGLGMRVGEKRDPVRRAGLYVPGGQVPLVSTVIMTAIPARVARVPEIVVCTPPDARGHVNPALLGALHACGIREAYRAGGAQAIAAMAYGTATIPRVDKVYGPGNAYVMEAKRRLFGQVGVDLLPGPSEVMVIADEGANPEWVAADLAAQAEHGTGKEKLFLAVPSAAFLTRVDRALRCQLASRTHAAAILAVWEGRTLVVRASRDEDLAAAANAIAPEHLELQVADPRLTPLTRLITTAGAILQGYLTPTVLGDFVAGPSHTLPTDGTGAFSSGLRVEDFLRRTSLVRSTAAANARALETVNTFGRLERLDAHAASLAIRHGKDPADA